MVFFFMCEMNKQWAYIIREPACGDAFCLRNSFVCHIIIIIYFVGHKFIQLFLCICQHKLCVPTANMYKSVQLNLSKKKQLKEFKFLRWMCLTDLNVNVPSLFCLHSWFFRAKIDYFWTINTSAKLELYVNRSFFFHPQDSKWYASPFTTYTLHHALHISHMSFPFENLKNQIANGENEKI